MGRVSSGGCAIGDGSDGAVRARIDGLFEGLQHAGAGDLAAFLGQGGDPDTRNEDGDPLLVVAAFNEVADVVALLIGNGAETNRRGSKNGTTALMAACEKGNLSIVNMLLDAGADPNLQNNWSQTALLLAARDGFIDIVKLLLDLGVPVDVKEMHRGGTALSYAAAGNYLDIARLLLGKGADVDSRDLDECTPLILAGWKGSRELFRLLVESGADVNACNYVGLTPLIEAAARGNYDACEYLIEKGANVRFESLMTNAVSVAKLNHNQDIIDLLLRHGARPEGGSFL